MTSARYVEFLTNHFLSWYKKKNRAFWNKINFHAGRRTIPCCKINHWLLGCRKIYESGWHSISKQQLWEAILVSSNELWQKLYINLQVKWIRIKAILKKGWCIVNRLFVLNRFQFFEKWSVHTTRMTDFCKNNNKALIIIISFAFNNIHTVIIVEEKKNPLLYWLFRKTNKTDMCIIIWNTVYNIQCCREKSKSVNEFISTPL